MNIILKKEFFDYKKENEELKKFFLELGLRKTNNLRKKEARVTIKHCKNKVNVCYSKDIKEKILEFEKVLQINYNITNDTIFIDLLKDYKEIFGDWEK